MLQFWTLAIFYTIGDLNEFNGTGYGFDCNRVKCGEVSLDGFEDSTSRLRMGRKLLKMLLEFRVVNSIIDP